MLKETRKFRKNLCLSGLKHVSFPCLSKGFPTFQLLRNSNLAAQTLQNINQPNLSTHHCQNCIFWNLWMLCLCPMMSNGSFGAHSMGAPTPEHLNPSSPTPSHTEPHDGLGHLRSWPCFGDKTKNLPIPRRFGARAWEIFRAISPSVFTCNSTRNSTVRSV